MLLPGSLKRLIALFLASVTLLAAALAPFPAAAQDHTVRGGKELIIATHAAPPFAMKGEDGKWDGIAIDLWRSVAADRGYSYRFVDTDLADMIDGVVDGKFDASVGALTITSAREQKVDFALPYYTTGFGIVVRRAPTAWFSLFTNFFTMSFLRAVLGLGTLLLVAGLLFWLAERRHNKAEFAEGWKGIGSGFWFSAVTMTTVGYGDKAPRTAVGKVIALIWMFAGIIVISTYTGLIASSLTADRLGGAVAGPDDLPGVAVGSIKGSASDEWLTDEGVAFTGYPNVRAGLAAVQAGKIDAFVYDKPLLRYRVRNGFAHDLRLLPGTFGRQDYGIALPQNSPLREGINVSLLRHIEGNDWREEVRRVLGKSD